MARKKPKHVPAGFKEGGQFFGPKSVRTLLVKLFRGKETEVVQPATPTAPTLVYRSLRPDSTAVRRIAPPRSGRPVLPARSGRPPAGDEERLTRARGAKRLQRVDRARPVAETLIELDHLRSRGASPDAVAVRVRALAGQHLPASVADELVVAGQSGDAGRVDQVLQRVAGEHGLVPTGGPAGSIQVWHRAEHEVSGEWPSGESAAVEIIRRGFDLKVDDGRQIELVRPVVRDAAPLVAPPELARWARERDLPLRARVVGPSRVVVEAGDPDDDGFRSVEVAEDATGDWRPVAGPLRLSTRGVEPRERAARPVALIPPARPRQPRTHKAKKPPRRQPVVSDTPTEVRVTRQPVKKAKPPRVGKDPTPRTNARVADPRVPGRMGFVTQLHEDRGLLVVRWDDGRSQTLPITALYPTWRPVRGTFTPPPVDAATLTRRVREAADARNSDEMRLLLGRMSDADLAAFARRLGVDKRHGLGRDDLVSRVIALLLSQELDRRYAKLLPDSPAVTRMTRRGR